MIDDTISGAAASPNMGIYTSPFRTYVHVPLVQISELPLCFGFRGVDARCKPLDAGQLPPASRPEDSFPTSASSGAGFFQLWDPSCWEENHSCKMCRFGPQRGLLEFARVRGIRRVHRSKCGSCSTVNLFGLRYRTASGSLNRAACQSGPAQPLRSSLEKFPLLQSPFGPAGSSGLGHLVYLERRKSISSPTP